MVLPPLYQKWMDELLPAGIAPEARATCGTCANVDRGQEEPPDRPFKPTLKCCTYHPELPNFLLGRILDDQRPEGAHGRRVLEARIATRVGVTPYGLAPPASFTLVFQNASIFGRADNMLCPFFVAESGTCGIHAHREGMCSTYFCRHNRGPSGRAFWKVLNVLLRHMNVGLRSWCVDQVDKGGSAAMGTWMEEMVRSETPDDASLAGLVSPDEYAWVWGDWIGREAELYRACAALVEPLGLQQVLDICGAHTRAAARVVKLLHGALTAARLPAKVARGSGLVQIGSRPGCMRLKHATAPHDQIEVPAEIIASVPLLTTGLFAEVLAEMRAGGLPIDDQTIRWLLDFEIIVPAI